MMRTRKATWAVAPFALLLAASCAPAATTTAGAGAGAAASIAITPELIAEGRQLFTGDGRCGVCHGPTGRGGSLGPNLTDDEWIWIEADADMHAQIATIIRVGIEEPREYPAPMPAMGGGNLTDRQVNALAAYVGTL